MGPKSVSPEVRECANQVLPKRSALHTLSFVLLTAASINLEVCDLGVNLGAVSLLWCVLSVCFHSLQRARNIA